MTVYKKLDNLSCIGIHLLVQRNLTNRETNMSYAKKFGMAVAATAFSAVMVAGTQALMDKVRHSGMVGKPLGIEM